MRRYVKILIATIIVSITSMGCSNSNNKVNVEQLALEEATKISKEQGYTLKQDTYYEIQLGDSEVFKLIKKIDRKTIL